MNRTARKPSTVTLERAEEAFVHVRETVTLAKGLSFLWLNSYPDTGESGDAYDVEAMLDN